MIPWMMAIMIKMIVMLYLRHDTIAASTVSGYPAMLHCHTTIHDTLDVGCTHVMSKMYLGGERPSPMTGGPLHP
jgi:hypothetical protein